MRHQFYILHPRQVPLYIEVESDFCTVLKVSRDRAFEGYSIITPYYFAFFKMSYRTIALLVLIMLRITVYIKNLNLTASRTF